MSQSSMARPFTKINHKEAYDAISSSQPSLSMKGKTVLITGGTQGIGFAIATAYAAAGASDVIIVARKSEALAEARKSLEKAHSFTRFHTFAASVDDAAKTASIFKEVRAQIAEPDVLVLNAGSGNQPAPILQIPVSELVKDFDINVKGNLNYVSEYLKPETLTKHKIILNVSSTAAHIHIPGIASYGAAKAAFVHLLMHLQREYADKDVRITSFHPGAILTTMARQAGYDENSIPWENVNLPGQFALWLGSKEAAFLAGRFVYASWDVNELKARAKEIESSDLLTIGLIGEPAS